MRTATKLFVFGAAIFLVLAAAPQTATRPKPGPEYASDGQLQFPANYREWIYLSSGFDMSYNEAQQMDHHMFDNVFVNPEAWRAFVATGKWPDKTIFVLEARGAEGKGSINQKGNFQGSVMAVEVHVKDQARFADKWAFFGFTAGAKTAKVIPSSQNCYSCHSEHGAVDTTFVQFYPTLMPIATAKGTVEAAHK
ncbi:MAG: cytochrome P460 [Terriglobia bacterium]|nr:MAG: cytochrome P460 [Terriglobia bacterium]